MKSISAKLILLLAAAVAPAALLGGCTDTDIVPLPWDNLISLEGEFVTEDSDELQLPVKVLFVVDVTSSMGWVDENGIASGNDPHDLRATAVEQVIGEFCGQENYSFGVVRFAEDSDESSDIGPDQPEDVTGGFMKCEDAGDLYNKFQNAITKIKVADGWTPYMTTLALARRVIKDDIDTLSEETASITRYVLIFFSDGEPCHLTERVPGQWEMTGEDFDEIFHQIDRIKSLEEQVGDIILHTSYLDNDAVDDCNNQWTEEITSPQDLLQAMASRGGGTFRNFEEAEEIDFLDFVKGSVYRTYELAHVIATNLSARLTVINDELVLMPDSDADGLDDWEEQYTYGTNPIVADTDGDGCRDGLEVRKGFWPLSGIEACPADSLDPCAENSFDGVVLDADRDGLTDREELLVTFTNRMRADTDGDGLPDGLEALAGSNPHNDDIRVPVNSDGDTSPNWTEVRGHTLPHVDEERYKESGREFYEYLYAKSFIENVDGGRKRYHYQVENISLVETLPLCPTCEAGVNVIQLYLVQYADGFGKAPGVFRSSTIRQVFSAPDGRTPDRYNIEVSSKELALLSDQQASSEDCDGLDNDEDGLTDEDLLAPGCLVDQGVCASATKRCGGAVGWLDCQEVDYGPAYQPIEYACDGKDNDCDGETDEGGICGRTGTGEDLTIEGGCACATRSSRTGLASLLLGFFLLGVLRKRTTETAGSRKENVRQEIRAFIFKDGMYTSMLRFCQESLVIGRDHDVDLRIDDKSVSRSHASVRLTPQGLQLVDLKSHNGVWVNGRKRERCYVDRRDKITIGTYTLKFKLLERTQPKAAEKQPPPIPIAKPKPRRKTQSVQPPPVETGPSTVRNLHPPKVVVEDPKCIQPPDYTEQDMQYIEKLFPKDFATPRILPGCQVEPDEPANPLKDFVEPFSLLDNLVLVDGGPQQVGDGQAVEVIVYSREMQLTRVEHLRAGDPAVGAVRVNEQGECIISYTDEYSGQANVGGRIYSLQNLKNQAESLGEVSFAKLGLGDSAHLMHENGGIFVRPTLPIRLPEPGDSQKTSPKEWLKSPAFLSRAAFIVTAAITHLLVFALAGVSSAKVSPALHSSAKPSEGGQTPKAKKIEKASFGLDLTTDAEAPKPVAKKTKKPRPKKVAKAKPRPQARAMKKSNSKLDRQAIAKVVRQHMPEVQNCYEMGLLQDPRLTGQVVLEWTIAKDGQVRTINTVRNSLGSPTVAMCIAAELRNWKFPKPEQKNLIVSYPFVFSATSF